MVHDFTEKHLPGAMHERIHVYGNEKFQYQMREGKNLVDIGAPKAWGPHPDPGAYYGAEQRAVGGYPHYSQDPQPASDLRR